MEVWPQNLGVILGGCFDATRLQTIGALLLEAELAYTVHAPLEVNLIDLPFHGLQRAVLDASLPFFGPRLKPPANSQILLPQRYSDEAGLALLSLC